jgi:hypothetical protein
MYTWIWRHLPGGIVGKLAGSLLLIAGVVVLLFAFAFPWVEPRLPWNQVTVDTPAAPASVSPSPTSGAAP